MMSIKQRDGKWTLLVRERFAFEELKELKSTFNTILEMKSKFSVPLIRRERGLSSDAGKISTLEGKHNLWLIDINEMFEFSNYKDMIDNTYKLFELKNEYGDYFQRIRQSERDSENSQSTSA